MKEVKTFILMEVAITPNGVEITSKMIENSLSTFANKPIVYNKQEKLKDYRDDEIVKSFNEEFCIGYIQDDVVFENNIVTATVFFLDDLFENIIDSSVFEKNGKDNWQIIVNENGKGFVYAACELF
jgi:hypothetical protein